MPEEEFAKELMTPEEWVSSPSERDAIRWSALQAKAMGWSRKKFLDFLKKRYKGYPTSLHQSILLAGKQEFTRKLAGVVPMFRRPIRVRQYRRRK